MAERGGVEGVGEGERGAEGQGIDFEEKTGSGWGGEGSVRGSEISCFLRLRGASAQGPSSSLAGASQEFPMGPPPMVHARRFPVAFLGPPEIGRAHV